MIIIMVTSMMTIVVGAWAVLMISGSGGNDAGDDDVGIQLMATVPANGWVDLCGRRCAGKPHVFQGLYEIIKATA